MVFPSAKVRALQVAAILVSVGLAACIDTAPHPADPTGLPEARSVASVGPAMTESDLRDRTAGARLTHDALFTAVAAMEPWFGGIFLEAGELQVVTTDLTISHSRVTQVTEALLQVAGRDRLAERAGGVQLVEGKYSFAELQGWLLLIRPVLHQHGVHRVSISERANQISLATASAGSSSALSRWIEAQDIPSNAVRIEVHEPARLNHHWGGHAVEVELDGLHSQVSSCTLTQVVERRLADGTPAAQLYGITNSHCTARFGVQGSDAFLEGSTRVADAVWDHPLLTDPKCEAISGTTEPSCRYSDAALFEYRSFFAGQLNLHKIRPSFDSLHTEDMAFTGEIVNKYGRATFLTYGEVLDTCVDVWIPLDPGSHQPDPFGLLCHAEADYLAADGDSGGPVWLMEDWGEPWGERRMFAGIHSSSFGEKRYFSTSMRVWEEIVPDEAGWGTICLSFAEATPGSMTCAW